MGQQLADAFTGYLRLHLYEIDLRAKLSLLSLMLCGLMSLYFSIGLVVLTRRKKVEHGGNTATEYMQSISGQCDDGGQSFVDEMEMFYAKITHTPSPLNFTGVY